MPITPNIIHTIKHTVNAKVLAIRTDHAFGGVAALLPTAVFVMGITPFP
jgi:hypothetical protein